MTNNIAELFGIRCALEIVASTPKDAEDISAGRAHLLIKSDSKLCVQSLTSWRHNWEKKNWVTQSGQPVKNREIIQDIASLIDGNVFKGQRGVSFVHVRAHCGIHGNEMADTLANTGLDKSTPPDHVLP